MGKVSTLASHQGEGEFLLFHEEEGESNHERDGWSIAYCSLMMLDIVGSFKSYAESNPSAAYSKAYKFHLHSCLHTLGRHFYLKVFEE